MRLAPYATFAVLAGCLSGSAPVRGDHGPVVAVPGDPTVPVIIKGRDASWAVVEQDWGLYRPGHGTVTVSYVSHPAFYRGPSHYFPRTDKRPGYGRLEIVPPANRRLPRAAESFHRVWSNYDVPSATGREYPAYDPPPVIMAPPMRLEK